MGERSIHAYHKECIEIGETASFQHNEILAMRARFLEKAKLTQERRCLTSLRAGYCLKMRKSQVKKIASLPFMKPDGASVKDRLIEISCNESQRAEIIQFLQDIYSNIDTLSSILADQVNTVATHKTVPYLPADVVIKDFLACSTLPALFGHCWTFDLKLAYISFIVDIAKQVQKGPASSFREHWIFDCFKSYIYASDIHMFLKLSMGDKLFDVIRMQESDPDSLIQRAKEIVEAMEQNISRFPIDVRILLRKFGCLTPDGSLNVELIEMLFMDCILAPAISMPKTYCVLPPTFHVQDQTTPAVLTLGNIFRLILHPDQARTRHANLNIDKLSQVPFGSFLKKLANVDPETVTKEGLTLAQVMRLLGQPCAIMLFTMNDVYLLADILANVYPTAQRIRQSGPIEFQFFRYDLWGGIETMISEKLDIRVNEVERAPPTTLGGVASALFKFLSYAPFNELSPNTLTDFLKFQERQAHVRVDFKAYTYLNHVVLKLQELLPSEYPDILEHLDDEIRRQREFLDRNYQLLNAITVAILELDREIDAIHKKTETSYPIMYSALLDLWLDSDASVAQKAMEQSENMLISKESFVDFFTSSCAQMKAFISPFADYAVRGVCCHFHTWLCQIMTLKNFIRLHRQYEDRDSMFCGVSNDVIQAVCVQPAPAKLKVIFDHREVFEFCRIELINAEYLQYPLECVVKITSAVNIIQKIFELACGGLPQADEMTPLFSYALLISGMSEMVSLQKYLAHFLVDIKLPDMKLLDESVSVALTHFINHVSSLDDIVESFQRGGGRF